jgi:hypothetical protein
VNVHVKVLLFPVPGKFNTFNTFNTFDLVASTPDLEAGGVPIAAGVVRLLAEIRAGSTHAFM